MDIVSTLTLRHIKNHKKRSVLTVLAIIVSVAMVTAVFTSAISFINYFKNVTLAVDGNWHTRFTDGEYKNHKELFAADENIEEFSVRTFNGISYMGIKNQTKPLQVFGADKKFFDMRNVAVSEGRLPKNGSEMLLTRGCIYEFDITQNVGDILKIPFTVSDGETGEKSIVYKEYKIVGISNSRVSATDDLSVFTGIDEKTLETSLQTDVFVRYDSLDNSIWGKIENTANNTKIKVHQNNYDLFMYSGILKDNSMLYSLGSFVLILLLIITVVSVFMIYDSFAVSYQERAKYLGMLSSVGATKKQKRKSIYLEGFVLGIIGIPIGIISGVGGIAVTFKCIEEALKNTMTIYYDGTLKVYVNWIVISATVFASAVTIFISAYIPARRASKATAIEAIRQTNTVKIKKPKKLRTSKITNKIFGYEGALAVKNYKRNGKRSRNIVFALSLSVVIFLTVANFTSMLSDVMQTEFISSPDVTVGTSFENRDKISDTVKNTMGIKRYFSETHGYVTLDKKYLSGEYGYSENKVILVFLDNKSMDDFAKQVGKKPETFHDKNNPACIFHNSANLSLNDGKKLVKANPFKNIEGDTIPITMITGYDENGKDTGKKYPVKIDVQTDTRWHEEKFWIYNLGQPIIFMSEDFIDVYFGAFPDAPFTTMIHVMCDEPAAIAKKIKTKLNNSEDIFDFHVDEINSGYEQMNNILMIAKVFIYGFITLITIISIMNIINTISNSMNERRREFAMIRSVGMTPKSFKRMIYLEAMRYGLMALLFSFPAGLLVHFGLYKALSESMDFGFKISPLPYFVSAVFVFAIIGISLLYSLDKIRDDNIIETLKTDIN